MGRLVIIIGRRHGSQKWEMVDGPSEPDAALEVKRDLVASSGKAEKGKGYAEIRGFERPSWKRVFPSSGAAAKAAKPSAEALEILALEVAVAAAPDGPSARAARKALDDARAASAAKARAVNEEVQRASLAALAAERKAASEAFEKAALEKARILAVTGMGLTEPAPAPVAAPVAPEPEPEPAAEEAGDNDVPSASEEDELLGD